MPPKVGKTSIKEIIMNNAQIQAHIKEFEVKLRVSVEKTMADIGDIVEETTQEYAELAPEIGRNPNLVIDIITSAIHDNVKLPFWVPNFAVSWVIKRAVSNYLIKK